MSQSLSPRVGIDHMNRAFEEAFRKGDTAGLVAAYTSPADASGPFEHQSDLPITHPQQAESLHQVQELILICALNSEAGELAGPSILYQSLGKERSR